MQIPVLIEPVANNGYRARCGEPLPLQTEGATREEAVRKLNELLELRLQKGGELTSLEIGKPAHPLFQWAGWLKNDPLFEEWQQAIEENRRRDDEELGLP